MSLTEQDLRCTSGPAGHVERIVGDSQGGGVVTNLLLRLAPVLRVKLGITECKRASS